MIEQNLENSFDNGKDFAVMKASMSMTSFD